MNKQTQILKATTQEAESALSKGLLKVSLAGKLTAPKEALENKTQQNNSFNWVHWFGLHNDFARDVLDKIKCSPTSARIISDKVVFTTGHGFIYGGRDMDKISTYALSVNACGENLHDVFEKLVRDFYSLGNAFLEVIKIGERINLQAIDASTMLVAKPEDPNNPEGTDGFYYCANWKNYQQFKQTFLPKYPHFKKVDSLPGERCVIHIRNYQTGYYYYGLPDFYAAYYSGWMNIDYQIAKYNESRFENQFRPSGILIFTGSELSDEQSDSLTKKVQDSWQGEGKNSKVIIATVNDPGLAPKWIQFEDAPQGAFESLQQIADDKIISAHNWHPSLVVQQAGKLSNASDIQTAFELVSGSYINPRRKKILRILDMLFAREFGWEVEPLEVKASSPVSYNTQLNPQLLFTINEQRKMLGEPIDETSGTGDKYLFEVTKVLGEPQPAAAPAPVKTK